MELHAANATEKKQAFEQMVVRRKSERIWRSNADGRSL